MTELQYHTHGELVSEPIGPVRPESPFSLDDSITPENERRLLHAAAERERLSDWDGIHVFWGRKKCLYASVQHSSRKVTVERWMSLLIVQVGLTTRSVCRRELTVAFAEIDDTTEEIVESEASRYHVEAAIKERRMTLNRWWRGGHNIDVGEIEITLNGCEIFADRRGIHSFLREKISIEPSSREITFRWEVMLEEEGPAFADDDPHSIHPDAQTPGRARAELRIQRATEKIQGANEWFKRHVSVVREVPSLERATTNISEVPDGWSVCDFCSIRHRYGDCLMDWTSGTSE
jgi:hypothetical protein